MATEIICRASDCIYWDDKICTSDKITYDPEEGCLNYEMLDDVIELDDSDDDDWEDDELLDDDDDDDDLWDDDEEDDDLFADEDEDPDKWVY